MADRQTSCSCQLIHTFLFVALANISGVESKIIKLRSTNNITCKKVEHICLSYMHVIYKNVDFIIKAIRMI